ncbi:MAG: hypothetical protein DWI58_16420, partial [Chloroflexi bacterium]
MADTPNASLATPHAVALHLAAKWMSEKYYRTFRLFEESGAFDAVLQQRDRRVGVTISALWEETGPVEGADVLGELLTADMRA